MISKYYFLFNNAIFFIMSQEATTPENESGNKNFSAYNIIQKKRDAQKLTNDEIRWFINGLADKSIADYQMSALLMSIYIQGMDVEETAALTDAMLYSGKVLDFQDITVIDKHSTGGVGDKASFVLAPIAAACGVKVPMIAGRGLGHTGGTVDKIESISGFKTDISLDEFQRLVKEEGQSLIGQTAEIAPADRKIYALRDVTATVESIPLITASIMSKKLAEGASGIVMDVKTGAGAFMSKKEDARELAKSLQDTGLRFGKNMMTIISDMSQPLGNAVGNSLEIIESVETLKGNGPKDLTELSLQLAGGMVHLAGLSETHEAGIIKARAALNSGEALQKFEKLISNQGGDPSFINDYSKLPLASEKTEVLSTKTGFITSMHNREIGLHCVDLGGGRQLAEDKIDFGVGFIFHNKIGHTVEAGESLATIYHNKDQIKQAQKIASSIALADIEIESDKPEKDVPLVYETEIKWAKSV
jgi:pyrimidine-nucleoside phosphorylase